jgi:hypothetical protein
MESMEREIKKELREGLKGVASSTLENLVKRIITLPYERVRLATDIGLTLASTNLRAAVEMLKVAPEVSRLIDAGDLKVWGEAGKRLSATGAEVATDFFRSSAQVLDQVPEELRSPVLRLVNKQAALSANTALESFKAAPSLTASIKDQDIVAHILTICLELARHSVKHSSDLFLAAPSVIIQLESVKDRPDIIRRALALTASFAFRSGGTASEFFIELPQVVSTPQQGSLNELFNHTESYLERSGGVALQYFKAAARILVIAGEKAFDRWTSLAKRVALQGNAASYHFMKASPQIISDLAARSGPQRRAQAIAAVLEVVEEIAEKNTVAAVECFKASPIALSAASLGQFRDWARRGLEKSLDSTRRVQAYYALESKASQESLFKVEGGLTLDSVAQTLRLYVEGLTGRALTISSLSSIPDESKIGDGKTIYLPSVVAEFESEAENFRLFKVLAAHAAGQVEFGTYARGTTELIASLEEVRAVFRDRSGKNGSNQKGEARRVTGLSNGPGAEEIDFLAVLSQYPNTELAIRLFTTIENGRIDFLLRRAYRGIRRDLDAVRARLIERRPDVEEIPEELLPFELLFQIAICGGATMRARQVYPAIVAELEQIISSHVFRDDATVGDSLLATGRIYSLFVEQPGRSDSQPNSESAEGDSGPPQGSDSLEPSEAGETSDQPAQVEVREDPFSYWSSGQTREVLPDHDIFNRMQTESPEQDLEKGDRSFYYDEWDRELGDYRTRWCRIIERAGSRGSRGFVEMVRSRYAGIISSVRYQFQLLRPENLRRVRGEIDGEDYDLQAVIDYALDKRSSGLIDDRLYTRKLRRERDVAVSFLLDMSSSTARTISRNPSYPYTQPGQRIIDIEKEGLVLMSEALEAVGDIYSMQGFTSEGRRNVKFYVIKDFTEGYSPEVERRIGGITYQNNTRLGAAIRHATTRLARQEARTKLLIVLSDGRPYDHDYGDSRYAREDTRVALRQARLENITPFCITIDRESEDQLRDMYGEVGYTIIDDVLSLPERLPGIYSRLTT